MQGSYSNIPIIDRMTIILDEILGSKRGLTATEILKFTKIPKTTLYRLLVSMEENGFIAMSKKSGIYHLGTKFADTYESVNARYKKLKTIAKPFLQTLADEAEDTVKLSILFGLNSYTLATIEGTKPIRISINSGAVFPLHAGATGKILLASLSENEISYYMKRYGRKYTDNTIVDTDKMLEVIKKSREEGYATDYGEYLPEISAFAVPVFDEFNDFFAAISVTLPSANVQTLDTAALISLLKQTSAKITEALKSAGESELPVKIIK